MTTWAPSPNYWPGRGGELPIAIVIHTMAGTLASCTAWFCSPASEVSAHYGVGLDGEIQAYVRTRDSAWANGILEPGNAWPRRGVNPNRLTVSIETEDLGDPDQEVTDEQFASVRTLVRTVHARHPSIGLLMGHDRISPASRAHCPGSRWRASGRLHTLAEETGLQLL